MPRMTAWELAFDYVTLCTAERTVNSLLKSHKEIYDRTGRASALTRLKRQKRRLGEIRRAMAAASKALGKVEVPMTKAKMTSVWPSFVDRLTGRLVGSWRLNRSVS